jgi:hypothetical protein
VFVLTAGPETSNHRKRTDAEILTWFQGQFWPAYPRKVARAAAAKAALKLRTPELRAAALAGLRAQLPALQQRMAEDPRMVPHPATWLNQERWSDEPDPPAQGRPLGPTQAERHRAEFERKLDERLREAANAIRQE